MLEAKKVIPIWQPVGYSTHLITQRVAEKINKKTSHTGTLDPMAEGVIIVLSGSERLRKKEYAEWEKEYYFEITFGIKTDTYDGLGLMEEEKYKTFDEDKLREVLSGFIGQYTQKIPPFSTKKISGRHLHQYASRGIKAPKITKLGKIFTIELNNFQEVSTLDHIEEQVQKIQKVKGNFRQTEIIKCWQDFLNSKNRPKSLKTANIRVKTSKGIYIRSLSQDVADRLGAFGFTSEIIRLSNGKYSQKECFCMQDIFSTEELSGDYFYSKFKSNLHRKA